MALYFSELENIFNKSQLPDKEKFLSLITEVTNVLDNEDSSYRPVSDTEQPGALIEFADNLPTIIIPDLHSRFYFLLGVLKTQITLLLGKQTEIISVFEALKQKKVRVICIGDALHSEKRAKQRWIEAQEAFFAGNIKSPQMIEEMSEGLSLIELIMKCKCEFPESFHFLKGNHENIQNEEGNGNHSFRKFALEGEMVREFIEQYYDHNILQMYAQFEYALPLIAKGFSFIATHAEPARVFTKQELINGNLFSNIIEELTWTKNDSAEPLAVETMLAEFFPNNPNSLWFGGHRAVLGKKYEARCNNRFIQFHNPNETNVVFIHGSEIFNLEKDIIPINCDIS